MENITYTLSNKLCENIGKTVFGKEETIRLLLCAFFSGGHVLMEDVPGTGKTSMIRALAQSVDGLYNRIQFTPDLLPSDVTGVNYYHQHTGKFILRKGPVFSNLLLADEINRATPRTQSALLECMEEKQVTIDGETSQLPDVFMVMATMNPLEFQGTFPLPEAQIDRFMMKLHIGYPDEAAEQQIVEKIRDKKKITHIEKITSIEEVLEAREEISKVHISDALGNYIVRLVRSTRSHESIKLGVSPRGVVAMTKAARTWAAMNGRDFVLPDDVKTLAVPVLAHRLIPLAQGSVLISKSGENLIEYLVSKVPVPIE